MALTLCLVVVGTLSFWPEQEVPELRTLNSTELDDLSDLIRGVYRDGQGIGDRLVGQLDSDWKDLSDAERAESAQQISDAARELGIKDLMLFDERYDLQVYYTEGSLRTLARIRALLAAHG